MLLLVSSLALLMLESLSAASGHKPDVPTVVVEEGSNALLRCSPDPLKNLVTTLFDWKMGEVVDQRKDVFMYRDGKYDGNGFNGQHEQFKGRVSHFPDQLINGNASIIINDTRIEDTGLYSCIFPFPRYQTFSMKLVVTPTFRDRSGKITGVAHEPYISICDVSEFGVQLKCEAKGASPKPELQWLDSDGVVLPAEVPEVSQKGNRFDVTLQTTVNSTKTNSFRCVLKQEDAHHEIGRNITVPERLFEKTSREPDPGSFSNGVALGTLIGALLLGTVEALLAAAVYIRRRFNKAGLDSSPSKTSSCFLSVIRVQSCHAFMLQSQYAVGLVGRSSGGAVGFIKLPGPDWSLWRPAFVLRAACWTPLR